MQRRDHHDWASETYVRRATSRRDRGAMPRGGASTNCSDAPFGSTTQIAAAVAKFELPPADIKAIQRENAVRLFPRSS